MQDLNQIIAANNQRVAPLQEQLDAGRHVVVEKHGLHVTDTKAFDTREEAQAYADKANALGYATASYTVHSPEVAEA